jgi:hypothetical protein
MKNLFVKILLVLGIVLMATEIAISQAHLYSSRDEIVEMYPDLEKIEIASDDGGKPYLVIEFYLGNFIYFFNSDDYCTLCYQVPHTDWDMNMQVKEYNHKYVAMNNHQWKAYVGEGVILITLEYDTGFEKMVFTYYSTE